MPYLGRSPGSGVRTRFIYAATAGQTSFSGNDSNSVSLAYEDTLYMDVYQNGVLLKPVTDYAATTGTSVVLTTGASTDDVVEMVVYDTFAVADTVSAKDGGTFSGNVAMGGTLSLTGNADFNGDLDVDGTTNLDVVDIDGAVDMASTLTVAGVLTAAAGSIGMGPAFFAHPASGQSISANTFTKVVLGTEVYDTDSKFASSRFTPTIAGYYQINASVTYANANFTQTGAILAIYKNGSSYAAFNSIIGGFEQRHGINGSALVYLDSDDYVEMFIYGPGQTVAHDTGETHFSGGMVRKA